MWESFEHRTASRIPYSAPARRIRPPHEQITTEAQPPLRNRIVREIAMHNFTHIGHCETMLEKGGGVGD